ncbi:flagellar motor protein MotA [Rhodospirillaceae bacterium KN72]|uniref:Flagellar motor protein MotA n=1 Tax=Pacificispira spongiicola TaxID=2729598 RepID=A0A7Y0DWU9_9PROT|nr:flagellar motor protein MotA [Pacificispira spongiicola]NMM42963.1 flagellar motor protein MotA [Pacificispira spongiicola]
MSTPTPFLLRMGIFLMLVAIGCFLILPALEHAFVSNVVINGVILGALLVGIVHAFRTVIVLYSETSWIQHFRMSYEAGYQPSSKPPRLLASAATMLSKRSERGQMHISAGGMQTILDGVSTRLDESRETGRYLVGLLVFLGLLGTFWGLLETVRSVGGVIGSLNIGSENVAGAFENLKQGLQTPLSGMGTAFASSLFGLAGSLILGFLGLQSGQAQNRFYNELEDWLSGLTRLSSGSIGGDGDQSVPAYIQALLEQTADSLESLQRTMARAEETRLTSHNDFVQLNDKLAILAETMRTEHDLMAKLAEGQKALKDALVKIADGSGKTAGDADAGRHLRNIDTQMVRLIEESSRGRADMVQELRSELRILARTIAATKDGGHGGA